MEIRLLKDGNIEMIRWTRGLLRVSDWNHGWSSWKRERKELTLRLSSRIIIKEGLRRHILNVFSGIVITKMLRIMVLLRFVRRHSIVSRNYNRGSIRCSASHEVTLVFWWWNERGEGDREAKGVEGEGCEEVDRRRRSNPLKDAFPLQHKEWEIELREEKKEDDHERARGDWYW